MSTCQISCTELVQRGGKILTPHWLLRNWCAMAHFEAEITRFPNMYDKEPKLYSEISDFDFLSVSFDFLHEITL